MDFPADFAFGLLVIFVSVCGFVSYLVGAVVLLFLHPLWFPRYRPLSERYHTIQASFFFLLFFLLS